MTIRITFDDNTVDLKVGNNGLQTNFKHEKNINFSSSGKAEVINIYGIQENKFDAFFDDTIYRILVGWWSWARQGKSWSFTMDLGATASTILIGGVTSAQPFIHLSSTTGGLSAGGICILSSVDDDEYELIEIASVEDGSGVTSSTNILYDYFAGDYFRHLNYFPKVISTDEFFNPTKNGSIWTNTFKFIEEK